MFTNMNNTCGFLRLRTQTDSGLDFALYVLYVVLAERDLLRRKSARSWD